MCRQRLHNIGHTQCIFIHSFVRKHIAIWIFHSFSTVPSYFDIYTLVVDCRCTATLRSISIRTVTNGKQAFVLGRHGCGCCYCCRFPSMAFPQLPRTAVNVAIVHTIQIAMLLPKSLCFSIRHLFSLRWPFHLFLLNSFCIRVLFNFQIRIWMFISIWRLPSFHAVVCMCTWIAQYAVDGRRAAAYVFIAIHSWNSYYFVWVFVRFSMIYQFNCRQPSFFSILCSLAYIYFVPFAMSRVQRCAALVYSSAIGFASIQ